MSPWISFELAILDAIQKLRSPIMDTLMVDISSLGNLSLIWICYMVIFSSTKEYKKMAKIMFISFILNLIVVNILVKNIVARPRPYTYEAIDLLIAKLSDGSFPSGHSSYAFSFATIVLVMATNKSIKIFTCLLAILIAFSRLYLYVHFPSDVLGGIVFGVIIALVSIRTFNWRSRKNLLQKDKNVL